MSRYIDADKVCKLLQNQADSIYSNTVKCGMCVTQKDVEQKTAILELIDLINKESTADVKEVVRGKWIANVVVCGNELYRCSNCDSFERFGAKFCHNCGADMRGVE